MSNVKVEKYLEKLSGQQVKSQKSKVESQKFNVWSKFEIVVVVWDGGAKKHTSYVLTKLKKLINNKTLF